MQEEETTSGKRSIEQLEDAVLGALDLYFEALLLEIRQGRAKRSIARLFLIPLLHMPASRSQ
jgi:hypothetical protein